MYLEAEQYNKIRGDLLCCNNHENRMANKYLYDIHSGFSPIVKMFQHDYSQHAHQNMGQKAVREYRWIV